MRKLMASILLSGCLHYQTAPICSDVTEPACAGEYAQVRRHNDHVIMERTAYVWAAVVVITAGMFGLFEVEKQRLDRHEGFGL